MMKRTKGRRGIWREALPRVMLNGKRQGYLETQMNKLEEIAEGMGSDEADVMMRTTTR